MEGGLAQGSGSAGQGLRNCRLVAASILVMAAILPVRAFAWPSPGGQHRGAEPRPVSRTALGRSVVPSWGARLTLRVYDYVPVDREVLVRAEEITGAIFEQTGIEIAWTDCTPLRGDLGPYPACPSEMGASDLVVRLLPRRMAKKIKVAARNEPLGFAPRCPEDEPACELTVFYFRIDELAAEGHRAEFLLGHVIAHEVAHVLMGPGHSEQGILRGEWSQEELRRMSLGLQLGFTNAQSWQLQDAARRRMRLPMPETSAPADSIAGPSKVGQ